MYSTIFLGSGGIPSALVQYASLNLKTSDAGARVRGAWNTRLEASYVHLSMMVGHTFYDTIDSSLYPVFLNTLIMPLSERMQQLTFRVHFVASLCIMPLTSW